MRFLLTRFLRRFTWLGRAADLVMVAGAAARIARSRGWIGSDTNETNQFASSDEGLSRVGETALVVGTLWRLLRRRKQRRVATGFPGRQQR